MSVEGSIKGQAREEVNLAGEAWAVLEQIWIPQSWRASVIREERMLLDLVVHLFSFIFLMTVFWEEMKCTV